METKENLNKGITLVALVITIIILLILAGVAITALTQTGLFENAKQAKNAMENAQTKENAILEGYANEINAFISNNRDEVEKSGSKINNLLDNSIEIPLKTPNGAWSYINQTIQLNDSIKNYDQIIFNIDEKEGNSMFRREERYFLKKNIEYNNSENEDLEKELYLSSTTLRGGNTVAVYELSAWFKDEKNLFIYVGGTNDSFITAIRIKSIYGIKY